ncbi:YdcF family protein [Enterococcus ureilyticus]|uniref:YdcF family protein n=1 Tax=Enterococcus ureilyticus TaxID=1131292 RepID=UPI001A9131E9|nr:YdcF family protein [Enterococcus ureilyticus]MBO0446147.1 YdcF family protein [Enterococcus ureilyticus]
MQLVFVPIIFIIIGILILLKERRSFVGGMIFAFGGLFLTLTLLLLGLLKLGEISSNSSTLVIVIVYALFPLLFLGVCVFFVINTHTMQTKEGRSVTAKLSALVGINLLIAVPAFFYLLSVGASKIPVWLFSILIFALLSDLLFSFLFTCYLFYSWMYQMIPINKKVDYIITLGSGIRSEEVPPLLKSRLDKAIEYYYKNPHAKIVVSGGQGVDEPVSEAFAMKKYLLSQQIPNNQILVEDRSTTTLENMTFSKKIIFEDWKNTDYEPTILFSTNNYHVLRGALYARKAHLKAEGIGAPTALYFLPTALIREYIALLTQYKWFTSSMILFCLLFVIWSLLPIQSQNYEQLLYLIN